MNIIQDGKEHAFNCENDDFITVNIIAAFFWFLIFLALFITKNMNEGNVLLVAYKLSCLKLIMNSFCTESTKAWI